MGNPSASWSPGVWGYQIPRLPLALSASVLEAAVSRPQPIRYDLAFEDVAIVRPGRVALEGAWPKGRPSLSRAGLPTPVSVTRPSFPRPARKLPHCPP